MTTKCQILFGRRFEVPVVFVPRQQQPVGSFLSQRAVPVNGLGPQTADCEESSWLPSSSSFMPHRPLLPPAPSVVCADGVIGRNVEDDLERLRQLEAENVLLRQQLQSTLMMDDEEPTMVPVPPAATTASSVFTQL